jgi:uncharacterized membrane protein
MTELVSRDGILEPVVLSHAERMFQTHPLSSGGISPAILACIQACSDCAQACLTCADACLAEPHRNSLLRCIRLNQDCATICDATFSVLSRQVEPDAVVVRSIVQACAAVTRACGAECRSHASPMKHCEVCADACLACEQACARVLSGGISVG